MGDTEATAGDSKQRLMDNLECPYLSLSFCVDLSCLVCHHSWPLSCPSLLPHPLVSHGDAGRAPASSLI